MTWNQTQVHEISNVIKKATLNKNFEIDNTFNEMFKMIFSIILFLFLLLYNACWSLKYHSKLFHELKTVILCKLIKKNYT